MNQDILKSYPDNHFDSIVTDPPYGIEFLGKDWDSNTGAVETWQECLRVLKPGGHLLAFSAARTYHHLATNIESIGFEIRDQIMWIYASGFPKAQDVGKSIDKRGIDNEWAGWKTALKPAHEPIVMARKPMKGSTIDNVLEHGVGALNIDATRLPIEDEQGRFPSNVLGDIPDYQKYFYCPKVSRAERHCGFEKLPEPEKFNNPDEMKKHPLWDPSIGTNSHRLMKKIREHQGSLDHIPAPFGDVKGAYVDGERMAKVADDTQYASAGNNHPTVKPVDLMKYLVKLVTPKGGVVLDPFNGSGSTGMACVELGMEYVGCELDPNYVEIANKRIGAWYERTKPDNNFNDLFED